MQTEPKIQQREHMQRNPSSNKDSVGSKMFNESMLSLYADNKLTISQTTNSRPFKT